MILVRFLTELDDFLNFYGVNNPKYGVNNPKRGKVKTFQPLLPERFFEIPLFLYTPPPMADWVRK